MAEVQSRPATRGGRGSGRAGRGGHSARGGGRSATSRHTNGDAAAAIDHPDTEVSLDDQGELGKLKKQYLTETVTLKELFPDWTDDDLVFALQDADGDLQTVIERITEGQISQFSDVKKKNREKSKPKTTDAATASADKPFGSVRGRGRGGSDSVRGGRGRGSDRGGRGSARGGRGGAARGAAAAASTVAAATPTDAGWGETGTAETNASASGWDSAPTTTTAGAWGDSVTTTTAEQEPVGDKPATTGAWGATTEKAVNAAADHTSTPVPGEQKSSLIPEGTKKTWASMLAQPKVQPVLPKAPPAAASASKTEHHAEPIVEPPTTVTETEPNVASSALLESTPDVPDSVVTDPSSAIASADLTPPRDELTEENLEHLPDTSRPADTETVISTRDPRSTVASTVGISTPQQTSSQQPIGRPAPIGGYAATALKATQPAGRSASYNRRLLDQTEAVVLPKDHAVERTTVQFGSMGLGSDKPSDVDDQPEEPETRGQLPQQSPAQPRASLPPPVQQTPVAQEPVRDSAATPKAAPGLPPAPQHSLGLGQPPYGQYGRYGGPGALSQEQAVPQKPYDAFGQQLNYPQGQSESGYPGHQQPQSSVASQAPGHHSTTSLNQNDYAAQYGDHQRGGYQSFYGGSYGQQHGTAQDHTHPPQRSASNLGTNESAYGSHIGQAQSRFNEATGAGSGQNTPAPTTSAQQAGPQAQTSHVGHNQGLHNAGGYPYQNPYYGGSYYNSYMNQYPSQYGYNQQGYGAPYGGKGGMYGQPHHGYGVSPQNSYEHSSSPAQPSGFGGSSTSGGRESAFGSSFNDYSRSGSTQPSQATSQPSGFGASTEGFGGRQGAFGGQSQSYGQASSAAEDSSIKAFHDTKTGPSPSLGQPGRSGSAMNNTHSSTGQGQNNFPPPGTQGFGGYPNQFNSSYGSQHGGLGGLGGQSGGHQSGGYGSAGFSQYNSQYGSYNQRGWGGNYGH